jgi:hypothetical protein
MALNNPPASQVLGLQVCVTMPNSTSTYFHYYFSDYQVTFLSQFNLDRKKGNICDRI